MLGHAGTATLIGVPGPEQRVSLDQEKDLFVPRATIRVCHGGDQLPAEDFPLLARLALEGQLDLERMVSRVCGLADVDRAFRDLEAGEVVRSVIRFA
jgi:Zn-dependent alcohol dehydrogenase